MNFYVAKQSKEKQGDNMGTLEVDRLLKSLKHLFEAECARGARDAVQKIMHVAQAGDVHARRGSEQPKTRRNGQSIGRRRAPHGAARAMIERILAGNAASVAEIANKAEGEGVEKSVSQSAIRLELKRGKKDNRYKLRNGKWLDEIGPAGRPQPD